MWRVEQSTATWNSERLQATVALTRPLDGIHRVRFCGARLEGAQWMQVGIPARLERQPACVEDAYTRGPDLIVTYEETQQSPVHPQVYWRIVDEPHASPGIVVEALVSMQTQMLDSDPRTRLTHVVPGRDWHCLDGRRASSAFQPIVLDDQSPQPITVWPPGAALLARIPAAPCSCGYVMLSTDLLDAHLLWDRLQCVSTLSTTHFGERLEKGILRRVRSRAILVPREQDAELVAQFLLDSVAAFHHR